MIGTDREEDSHAHEEALALLAEAIGDPSWRVRKSAVEVFLGLPIAPETREQILDKALRSEENAGKRNSAIEIYIRLGRKTFPHIVELVKDPDPDVRKFAVEILIENGGEGVEDSLLSCLEDEDENTRMAAVEGLGKVGTECALEMLLTLLGQSVPGMDFMIVKTLSEIGARGAVLPVEPIAERLEDPTLREVALQALGSGRNPEAVPMLEERIREGRARTREKALLALARLAASRQEVDLAEAGLSPEVILPFRENPKEEVRLAAVQVLSQMRSPRVLAVLLPIIFSGQEEMQSAARTGIVQLGPEALREIIEKYQDFPKEGRYRMMEIIGLLESGGEAELELRRDNLLREIITRPHSDLEEKAEAALAVGRLGLVGMAGALADLLDAPEETLSAAALSAMRFLSGRHKDQIVKVILSRINEGSETLRRNLILLLGEIQAEGVTADIVLALKAEDPGVREAAAIALADIGASETEEELILCLADEDPRVRMRSAQALGTMRIRKAVEPLRHALQDEDLWVRAAIAESLGQIGAADPSVIEALNQLTSRGEGPAAVAATRALAMTGGDQSRNLLVKSLRAPDPDVIIAALESLAPLREGEISPELFVSLISHPSFTVRLRAVQALKGIGKEKDSVISRAVRERLNVEEDPLVRESLLALLRSERRE